MGFFNLGDELFVQLCDGTRMVLKPYSWQSAFAFNTDSGPVVGLTVEERVEDSDDELQSKKGATLTKVFIPFHAIALISTTRREE